MATYTGERGYHRPEDTGRSRPPTFQLFQAALEKQNELAWMTLQSRFNRMLAAWLLPWLTAPMNLEDLADLQQQVWVKFWRNLSGVQLSERFPHEGAVLKYLKQCARTVALDHRRGWQRSEQNLAVLKRQANAAHKRQRVSGDDPILERLQEKERLQMVNAWLLQHVVDRRERLVLKLSFEEGLTPIEAAASYPAFFADANEVSRIKERIVRRARRALS